MKWTNFNWSLCEDHNSSISKLFFYFGNPFSLLDFFKSLQILVFVAVSIEESMYRCFRYRLPVTTVILNNNGIYRGLKHEDQQSLEGDLTQLWVNEMSIPLWMYFSLPVLSLSTECRYDKMAESLGGKGWLVRTKDEITNALKEVWVHSPSSLYQLIIRLIMRRDVLLSSIFSLQLMQRGNHRRIIGSLDPISDRNNGQICIFVYRIFIKKCNRN